MRRLQSQAEKFVRTWMASGSIPDVVEAYCADRSRDAETAAKVLLISEWLKSIGVVLPPLPLRSPS